eukprot:7381030-Prymnesium_polylepis.1
MAASSGGRGSLVPRSGGDDPTSGRPSTFGEGGSCAATRSAAWPLGTGHVTPSDWPRDPLGLVTLTVF